MKATRTEIHTVSMMIAGNYNFFKKLTGDRRCHGIRDDRPKLCLVWVRGDVKVIDNRGKLVTEIVKFVLQIRSLETLTKRPKEYNPDRMAK